jgi:type II secretory pathway pseudopilin PulG
MRRRGTDEAGDSLIEIVFALVIIGVVIGAFVASFSTGATASSVHRYNVTADVVLRNYAEATKAGARSSCSSTNVGAPFTITYPSPPGVPAGFTISSNPSPPTCPAVDAVAPVIVSVTAPNGQKRSITVEVRTP